MRYQGKKEINVRAFKAPRTDINQRLRSRGNALLGDDFIV